MYRVQIIVGIHMLDSYERLFSNNLISKDQLFDFGLSETIYVDDNIAINAWENLKDRIQQGEKVFIRGFGRDASGTHLFKKFYSYLLSNHKVTKDSSNNTEPTKLIKQWTGYSKNGGKTFKPIQNYQISHVFGRTKNVYCFTAPWNIVYVPKIIDPFTGHEAKGYFVDEYTKLFQQEVYKRFKDIIDDYNNIVTDPEFLSSIKTALGLMKFDEEISEIELTKITNAINDEFRPINVTAD